MKEKGFRVDVDLSPDKVGPKTWRAKNEKIPVTLVVGQKEMDAGNVAPRLLDGKQLEPMSLEAFAAWLSQAAAVPKGGVVAPKQ